VKVSDRTIAVSVIARRGRKQENRHRDVRPLLSPGGMQGLDVDVLCPLYEIVVVHGCVHADTLSSSPP